jgi:hypothetical protein
MTSSTKHVATDALKVAYGKGQNWINNRVERISNEASKFKIFKNGYNRIRPRIFPKGLATFREQQNLKKVHDDDNFTEFMQCRQRFHSVDATADDIQFSYCANLNGKYMSQEFEYNFGEFKG